MLNPVKSQEYDYYQRQKLIDKICGQFGFVVKTIIGRSCSGKNITALKIGSAKDYSLITASFHGSERITSTILLMFIYDLCKAIENNDYISGLNAKKALHGRGIIFVPCVNPDGCDIALNGEKACGVLAKDITRICKKDFKHWNANLRGVDINHNFDAGWAELRKKECEDNIFGPSKTRFGGYKPESEPETLALTELCRTINIRHVVALHSQGEVIYWNYNNREPIKSKKMAEILATSSGYALDVPVGLAEGGGFKDWFINEFNRPGFTIEVGKGENPLPAENAEKIYEKIKEMLILCCIM